MTQRRFLPREHHFYAAMAKFLFYHPEHGIVSALDPIRIEKAKEYGLSPLILYGVTAAGLPLRWITFTAADQPRPFREILLEGWARAEGLRGRPDILRISRYLALASPELVRDMAKIGVRVEVAHAREKSLPASLRSAQDASRDVLRRYGGKGQPFVESIQSLCRDAQDEHDFHAKRDSWGSLNREVREKIRQWMALPKQEVPSMLGAESVLDWEPGPWLVSWESSLPPKAPRYFSPDSFVGRTRLLTGEEIPEGVLEDEGVWIYYDDNAAEIAKNLVACWPNPPGEIAGCVGITLRKLQWFLSEKAPLKEHERFRLQNLLGIEYDAMARRYVGTGPYVLMARKSLILRETYEILSNGGDARPCEIVPLRGSADPSWRYLLINIYGEPSSVVMAPRGARITERLPNLLMNYQGVKDVPLEFYRDVVSTCARACREPEANIREMKGFAERCKKRWTGFFEDFE